MNADANHGRHERIMLLRVYKHAVQTIIIQDTVIDTFCCGTLLIYIFIGLCTSRDIRIEPDVPLGSGLNDASIFGRGAAAFTFGLMVFSIRTAPHLASNVPFGAVIISVWDHKEPSSADRSAVFINADVVMDRFGMSAFAVEVDQGTYIPNFEETVSGKIVHS